jgi:predicted protein tyrosine phosphatase
VTVLHVLFVCSRNQWRSPTAEAVFRREPGLSVRSAGTSARARRRVQDDDLRWADVVVCMEDKHAQRLRATFGRTLAHTPVEVLGIPDDYRAMDPALIEALELVVPAVLARHRAATP